MKRFLVFFCIILPVVFHAQPLKRTAAILDLTAANSETTDGEIYSAHYLLDAAGIPFVVTTSIDSAKLHYAVVCSSRLQNGTLSSAEKDTLAAYVSRGGLLLAPIVTDPSLYSLFGISSYVTLDSRHRVYFDTLAAAAESRWINDSNEVEISLGDTALAQVITTRAYALSTATALAHYDDSTVAITRNNSGNGYAYAFGFSWKSLVQLNQINKDYSAERVYSNGFEPTSDVIMLFVRATLLAHLPHNVWLHTSMYDSESMLLLTHDIDATTSYDTMSYYADYEYSIGAHASYLITTHYINDALLADFYNAAHLPDVQYLLTRGHVIGSHSVGHFPDFDDETVVPLGTQNVNSSNYLPFNSGNNNPTANATVYGEVKVSKDLLQNDFGVSVRTFRAGYLCYNDKIANALDSVGGYRFNTTYSAGDVLTNFPYRSRYDRNSSGMLSRSIWDFPMTISDVFNSNPITVSNYPQKVNTWLDVINRNRQNNAPNILLIHPTRLFKLWAETDLINNLPPGIMTCDLETYGDFWLARDSVDFTTDLQNDTLTIIVPFAQLPLHNAISFIVDQGQQLQLIRARDDNGSPLPVILSSWDDDDIIVHFGNFPPLGNAGQQLVSGNSMVSVYPNPAANEATIECWLKKSQRLSMRICDMQGREIYSWPEEVMPEGIVRRIIPANLFAAGLYQCIVDSGDQRQSIRLAIVH